MIPRNYAFRLHLPVNKYIDMSIVFIRIVIMKNISTAFLALTICLITGCEVPPTQPPADQKEPFDGLKVDDLQDTTQEQIPPESLLIFRIFRYTLVPGAADELNNILQTLSTQDVSIFYRDFFNTYGFAIGVG